MWSGSYPNGDKFASQRRETIVAGDEEMIRCFSEGLIGLQQGHKVELICPPEYAYGKLENEEELGLVSTSLVFTVAITNVKRSDGPYFNTNYYKRTITNEGSGYEAQQGDMVIAHYIGRFVNGKQFENSRDRKNPVRFKLGAHEVITCWDQGFEGLKQGATADLICPPNFAYGR